MHRDAFSPDTVAKHAQQAQILTDGRRISGVELQFPIWCQHKGLQLSFSMVSCWHARAGQLGGPTCAGQDARPGTNLSCHANKVQPQWARPSPMQHNPSGGKWSPALAGSSRPPCVILLNPEVLLLRTTGRRHASSGGFLSLYGMVATTQFPCLILLPCRLCLLLPTGMVPPSSPQLSHCSHVKMTVTSAQSATFAAVQGYTSSAIN
jgi:hypothetical protein